MRHLGSSNGSASFSGFGKSPSITHHQMPTYDLTSTNGNANPNAVSDAKSPMMTIAGKRRQRPPPTSQRKERWTDASSIRRRRRSGVKICAAFASGSPMPKKNAPRKAKNGAIRRYQTGNG